MSRSPSSSRSAIAAFAAPLLLPLLLAVATPLAAQEPVGWGEDLVFNTFSIVGIDPATGESGVAVTTRVACVGNAVPWVRPGVGAVATQGGTRLEYGHDLLDLLEQGVAPQEAMDRLAAEMDQVMARMQAADEAANVYGGCGPRLNEEMDPQHWLDQPGSPKPKVNEKPQGETIAYEDLIKGWQ